MEYPTPGPERREGVSPEKHGSIEGGVLTEEALASSPAVLRRARGGPSSVETKQCIGCKEFKALSEFNRKRKTVLSSRCKECKAVYDQRRRTKTNEARRKRSGSLKAKGICVRCGKTPTNPAVSGHTCEPCLEYFREATRRYRRRVKDALFDIYGGRVCACCGESEELFLSFDHINEDGARHRLSMGKRSNGFGFSDLVSLHRSLRQQGFPDVVQVLCHNCNHGKHLNGGACPHQEGK
jgi:hypothetical protein